MKAVPAHYALLGCPPAAGAETIHAAYRLLAFQLHPDRGGKKETFQALALAWGVLKNKEFRARYDAELKLLGLNCATCAGRGVTYRTRGFTARKEVPCGKCAGTGRNDL